MLDDIHKGETWTKELNFDDICYTWFDRLEKQTNNKGYRTRLFAINIETTPPTHEVLQSIGLHICKQVNEAPENKIVASVDKKDFIWIRDPTWADIIGIDQATRRLKEVIGSFNKDSYNQYSETVHSYFRANQLPQYLGRLIGAPDDQIEQDICETSTHQDCKSDSDSDDCNQSNKTTLI